MGADLLIRQAGLAAENRVLESISAAGRVPPRTTSTDDWPLSRFRAKPVRTNGHATRLPKHPRVKFKRLRISKLDRGEISMSGVQQHIPFSADRRRWNKQSGATSIPNPVVPESM